MLPSKPPLTHTGGAAELFVPGCPETTRTQRDVPEAGGGGGGTINPGGMKGLTGMSDWRGVGAE